MAKCWNKRGNLGRFDNIAFDLHWCLTPQTLNLLIPQPQNLETLNP